eukprot:2111966-Amphidinium_carterae.1
MKDYKPTHFTCRHCLHVKDNVYNICKQSDCLDFFREQRSEPAKWLKQLLEDPDTIVDEDGPTAEYRVRFDVKVKDLVVTRAAQIASQGYALSDNVNKKATQADWTTLTTEPWGPWKIVSTKLSAHEQARMIGAFGTKVFNATLNRVGAIAALRAAMDSEETAEKVAEKKDESKAEEPRKGGSSGASKKMWLDKE